MPDVFAAARSNDTVRTQPAASPRTFDAVREVGVAGLEQTQRLPDGIGAFDDDLFRSEQPLDGFGALITAEFVRAREHPIPSA